jgi:uroporphyrinogen decarboxylase
MGAQNGPLISPSLYRKLVKPRQKMLIETIKRKTNAKVFLHSCGAIYEFIPDFIEIGIDILNPVQVSARGMGNTERLKKEFGKDLVFWGGSCDSQHILPFGTPEDVRKETARRIEELKPGGGYVFAPIHNIQAFVPPENIVALFETAKEVGIYSQD